MKSCGKLLQHLAAAAVLTGLTFAAGAGVASAQQWYNGPPPPPPRYEAHRVRPGYTWEGGHWYRAGGRWVWQPGVYLAVRPGGHWVRGHWRVGPRGRYWVPGHWA